MIIDSIDMQDITQMVRRRRLVVRTLTAKEAARLVFPTPPFPPTWQASHSSVIGTFALPSLWCTEFPWMVLDSRIHESACRHDLGGDGSRPRVVSC
eukprot:458869-Pyramimonas_sp.AAC.1